MIAKFNEMRCERQAISAKLDGEAVMMSSTTRPKAKIL